jgi:hypothetical protein
MRCQSPFSFLRLFEALPDLFCGRGGEICGGKFPPGISNKKILLLAAMAAVFVLAAMPTASAQSGNWTNNASSTSGNWRAIIFPRVISSSTCADVGSLIVPAGAAWRKFKLLKGRKMLRDD